MRGAPLELSGDDLRRLAGAALDRIAPHIDSLGTQAAADTSGGVELARELLEAEPPEEGTPVEELLDLLFSRAVPKSFNAAAPGYMAYIPGGGLLHAAVGELIAASVNRYTGVFAAAPALVQLESNVVRWLARLVGLPPTAGGFLTSGGSLATFSAVVAARRDRLPEDFLTGTLYTSDQAHHCVAKAAVLAGFPESRVRSIPSDERFRIRLDLLSERIQADRDAGLRPFLIAGNAGTTNTGAVDDLPALADLAAREGLWLHVDAAYGGFFALTARGRAALSGLERADSIVLDPHKGLFLPYGSGCLLARDPATLRRAHAVSAAYLPAMQADEDLVDFCEISPELSRPYRGLPAWLAIKACGLAAFREALDEKLDLARHAADGLRHVPGIRIVAEPQLSVVAFRFEPEDSGEEAASAATRELLRRVNARQRVHLTGTLLSGRFVARICVLSFRTHEDRVDLALQDVREVAAGMAPVVDTEAKRI